MQRRGRLPSGYAGDAKHSSADARNGEITVRVVGSKDNEKVTAAGIHDALRAYFSRRSVGPRPCEKPAGKERRRAILTETYGEEASTPPAGVGAGRSQDGLLK